MTTLAIRGFQNHNRRLVFVTLAAVMATAALSTGFAQGRGNGNGRNRAASTLTGTYRLNPAGSDNGATVADRATRDLPARERPRLREAILRRLDAPDTLAIDRRGRNITMGSSRAEPVTFEADGRAHTEQTRNGRTTRTVTTISGNRLDVSTDGDRSIDFQVTFELINNGRGLRVTRRVTDDGLRQPVVARSVYDRTSDDAHFGAFDARRDNSRPSGGNRGDRTDYGLQEGTQIVATLDSDLSTRQARDEDPFTLTVRSPAQYEGARIDGRIAGVNRSGRVAGRADIAFDFDRIRFRDGRTANFDGSLESIRTTSGETLDVDRAGIAQDEGSQTGRTVTRTGVGAGIGAVIGAIAGGGKGAAIGAAVGAGAGAGSVLVQGRDDLELQSGTEFRLRVVASR